MLVVSSFWICLWPPRRRSRGVREPDLRAFVLARGHFLRFGQSFGTVWYTFGTALVHLETSKKINDTRPWYTWYTLYKGWVGVPRQEG
jgi:hypothetical protein